MANLWPWLAIAGLGALHGLSPANGWMFAAAWGVRARDAGAGAACPAAHRHRARRIDRGRGLRCCAGHVDGPRAGPGPGRRAARRRGVVPLAARRRAAHAASARQAGHAGIALWSFLMATAHGAGLMLVPALVPLCLADNPAREITASGSLVLALAAVGVHTAAMLVTTGVIATGVCRGVAMHPRLLSGTAPRQAWTAALAVTGVLLMALR